MLQSYYSLLFQQVLQQRTQQRWLTCGFQTKEFSFVITKQAPSCYMVGNINNQSQKQLRMSIGSCWHQVCRVTQSTAAHPNQPSPQHTMMQHQPQNSSFPLRYAQAILFLPFGTKSCANCGHIKISLGIIGPEAIWTVSNMGIKKWHYCKALLPLKFHSWTHIFSCTTQDEWWVLSLKQGIFNKTISCII